MPPHFTAGQRVKIIPDPERISSLGVEGSVCGFDGEIVCFNFSGNAKPEFWDLLRRRSEPHFLAFDLLWYNGQDLTFAPVIERKHTLGSVLTANSERVMYCDHPEQDGERLFRLACENDLEASCKAEVRSVPAE